MNPNNNRTQQEEKNINLALALSLNPPPSVQPPSGRPPPSFGRPPPSFGRPPPSMPPRRARRNPTQAPRAGKSPIIPVPYPWATNRRATLHSLDYLLARGIHVITGKVLCKRCQLETDVEYDLQAKFHEVGRYIIRNKIYMYDRAPTNWSNPTMPTCASCEQDDAMRPVISEKKRSINWLFLLLGQMLGFCTLAQLKYFCKHTKNHRTGAKDRVLYLAYLTLCKQLDPSGPFDR